MLKTTIILDFYHKYLLQYSDNILNRQIKLQKLEEIHKLLQNSIVKRLKLDNFKMSIYQVISTFNCQQLQ